MTTCAYCGALTRHTVQVLNHDHQRLEPWCFVCVVEVGRDEA